LSHPFGHPPGSSRRLGLVAAALSLFALLSAPSAAFAIGDSGSRPPPRGTGRFGEAVPGAYASPVNRPVSDPFRLDAGPYGAGNRGLEFAAHPGDVVRAIAGGRVAFAGPVVGRLVVSIDHADGRRSTLTHLSDVFVRVGDVVARGTPVGRADVGLHLGLLEGGRYVDPGPFLAPERRRGVLVAVEPAAS
jgi:murein DD-endopeptidase MepM/ murein hydrolase activator NlpD